MSNTIEVERDGISYEVAISWDEGDRSVGLWEGWLCEVDDRQALIVEDPGEALAEEILWGDGVWQKGDRIEPGTALHAALLRAHGDAVEEAAREKMSGVVPRGWYDG